MNYGTKQLERHNQRTAKVGDVVTLSPVCKLGLEHTVGVKADQATLTRKWKDGTWFATINGEEWCGGSGFGWRLYA